MKKTEFYLTTKEIHTTLEALHQMLVRYNNLMMERKLSPYRQEFFLEAKSLYIKLSEYELNRKP